MFLFARSFVYRMSVCVSVCALNVCVCAPWLRVCAMLVVYVPFLRVCEWLGSARHVCLPIAYGLVGSNIVLNRMCTPWGCLGLRVRACACTGATPFLHYTHTHTQAHTHTSTRTHTHSLTRSRSLTNTHLCNFALYPILNTHVPTTLHTVRLGRLPPHHHLP